MPSLSGERAVDAPSFDFAGRTESFWRSPGSDGGEPAQCPAAEITVYTVPTCIHCMRAKTLLARPSVRYEDVDVDVSNVPHFRQWLSELTGGRTVPQIIIGGVLIGAAGRLARLDRWGVLTAIAQNELFPITRQQRHLSPRSLPRWIAARLIRGRGISPFQRVELKLGRAGRIVEDQRTEAYPTKGHVS